MPWFGRKPSEPAPAAPAAPAEGAPPTGSPLRAAGQDPGTCFRLTGAFWITGIGSVVTGYLVAGTLNVGQRLQVFQARTGTLLSLVVEVEEIDRKNPHPSRVILSAASYDAVLPADHATAGPELLGLRVKGAPRGTFVKGDLLVSPGTAPETGLGQHPPS